MTDQDIRWQQRLKHYEKALSQLRKAVELSHERPLSEIERQGLIKERSFPLFEELCCRMEELLDGN